jgi:hypothetical protein
VTTDSHLEEAAAAVNAAAATVLEHARVGRWTEAAASVQQLGEQGDELAVALVAAMRAGGATWAAVGEAFGMSRQAATKRFASAVS